MDSSGLPDHKAIRQTMYKQADVVIFCFSLSEIKVHLKKKAGDRKHSQNSRRSDDEQVATSSTISLASIRYKWIKEVLEVISQEKNEEKKEGAQPADSGANLD